MLGVINRIRGTINVSEKNNRITINGVDSKILLNAIHKHWSTTRINRYLFTRTSRYSVEFYQFYALEVYYALQTLEKSDDFLVSIRVLRAVQTALLEQTWLNHLKEEIQPWLDRRALTALTVSLLDHQSRFLDTLEEQVIRCRLHGYLLAGAPGSGKTLTGIAVGLAVKAPITIIVAPKNAVETVWAKTLKEFFRRPPSYWVSTQGQPIAPTATYYIFHYEALERAVSFAQSLRVQNPFIILDESHNLNELTAQRTQRFIQLCQTFPKPFVLWASGTPIKAIGSEMVPFLKTIDPFFDDTVSASFIKLFGYSRSRASDILAHRLGYVTFKVTKDEYSKNTVNTRDVLVKIPNGEDYTLDSIKNDMRAFIIERVGYYEKNKEQYRDAFFNALAWYEEHNVKTREQQRAYAEYRRVLNQIIEYYDPFTMREETRLCNQYELERVAPQLPTKTMRDAFKNARSVVKYVHLKIQGEALGRVLGAKRVQCHVDMINHIGLDKIVQKSVKKTLIFTSYVQVVDQIAVYFQKRDYPVLTAHGKTGEDVKTTVGRFQTDFNANPLVATFKSLSTAVPLIEANTVVNINAPFRDYEYQQAISRVDRLGQDTPVEIINIQLDTGDAPNISTRSKDILAWSKEQVALLMGIPVELNPETDDEMSIVTAELHSSTEHMPVPFSQDW